MEATISRSIAKFALQFCNFVTQQYYILERTTGILIPYGPFKALREGPQELEKGKTTVCSPLSAETVLALTALGCRGQTQAELLQALDLPDEKAIKSLFKSLTPALQNIYGATLNTANKVYVKEGGTLKPKLKKDAEEVFGAELEQLDFKNSVAAAKVINQWVSENTKGKIKEIASADMLGERTSLFLVNAIYFKAFWDKQFKKIHTKNRKFHVDNATTVEVPMMYMEDKLMKYGSNPKLKAKFLEMPYRGGNSSMVIVLPDDIEGLNSVLQQLAAGHDVMADIEAMDSEALDITIPTFKAETTIDVKDLLQKLGIKSIFNETTSEIDMLTSPERLYVSHAVQKAYIMVNEAGTEASAATGWNVRKCCKKLPRRRIRFTADRPFLFLLTVCTIPVFVGVYRGGQETIPTAADLPPDDEQDSDSEF